MRKHKRDKSAHGPESPECRRARLHFELLERRLLLDAKVTTWLGVNNSFKDPVNWNNGVPVDTENTQYTAVFDRASSVKLDLNNVTMTNLRVNDSVDLQLGGNTLTVSTLDVSPDIRFLNDHHTVFTVEGGNFYITSALTVDGSKLNGDATLNVKGIGTVFNSARTTVGTLGPSLLSISGIATARLGTATVGDLDRGSLYLYDTGFVETGGITIGAGVRGDGAVVISGVADMRTGPITVGQNGQGDLQILNGSNVVSVGLQAIGAMSENAAGFPHGEATIAEDSTWDIGSQSTPGRLVVGLAARGPEDRLGGTLLVDDGGEVNVDGLTDIAGVGIDGRDTKAGTGAAIVTGEHSTLVTRSLIVGGGAGDDGKGSKGVLSVLDGATLTVAKATTIADGSDSTGTVSVEDGSTMTSGTLLVGNNGNGRLELSGGAIFKVTTQKVTNEAIGEERGGEGTVIVSGEGTTLDLASGLIVGLSGTGTLKVEDHGTVNSAFGDIGTTVPSKGKVEIGTSGTWNITEADPESDWGNANSQSPAEVTVTGGGQIISAGTINAKNAKVRGNGTIKDVNGGVKGTVATVISPGTDTSPIGTLTFDGNVNAFNSTLEEDIGAPGNADLVDSTGSIELGGSLNLTSLVDSTQYEAGDEFDLIHADGGMTGSFAQVDTSQLPLANGLRWQVLYDRNSVILKVVGAPAITAPDMNWNFDQGQVQIAVDETQFAQGLLPSPATSVAFYRSNAMTISSLKSTTLVGYGTRHVFDGGLAGLVTSWTLNVADSSFLQDGVPETILAIASDAEGQKSAVTWTTFIPYLDHNSDGNPEWSFSPSNSQATVTINPAVTSLTLSPISIPGDPLDAFTRLTATGVTGFDGGLPQSVTFYIGGYSPPTAGGEAGYYYFFEIGTSEDSTSSGDWTLDIPNSAVFAYEFVAGEQFWAAANGPDGEQGWISADYGEQQWTPADQIVQPPQTEVDATISVAGSSPRVTLSTYHVVGEFFSWVNVPGPDPGNLYDFTSGSTVDASVTQVSYYADTSGIGPFSAADGDAKLLGTVDSPGADGSWSLPDVDMSGYLGPETIYAVATNSLGWQSPPGETSVTIYPPVALNLAADSDRYTVGDSLTLSLTDPKLVDGQISNVEFYDGTTDLGPGSLDGFGSWTFDVDTLQLTGSQNFHAVATDYQSATYTSNSVTATPDSAATILGISATPTAFDSSHNATQLSLSADVDGDAQSVTFYEGSGGDFSLATPIGTSNAATNWTLPNVSTSNLASATYFFATVTDSNSVPSDPVEYAAGAGTITQFGVTANPLNGGDPSVTLTASGILNFYDGTNSITGVSFYRDLTGTAVFDPTNVSNYKFLGTASIASDGSASEPADLAGLNGPQTFFAVARSGSAYLGDAAVAASEPPAVDSLTANPSAWNGATGAMTQMTLVATASQDATGVEFYRDTSGTGQFTPGQLSDLGPAVQNADGSWRLPISTAGLSGPQTFFAVAGDASGLMSAPDSFIAGDFTIGNFRAVYDPFSGSGSLGLTAGGVVDWNGQVQSVTYYEDPSGSSVYDPSQAGYIPLGSSTDAASNWAVTAYPPALTGGETFFAVATDGASPANTAVAMTIATAQLGPTIASFTAVAQPLGTAGEITLTPNDVSDFDGTVQSITFYSSTTGSFVGATSLGTATAASGWSLNATTGTAAKSFFAVATDDAGLSSDPVAMSVNTTLEWDPTGSGSGDNGGEGDWSTDPLALDWFDPLTGMDEAWSNVANDTASFAGTGDVASAEPGIMANSLSFSSSGYTLQDGAIVLTGSGNVFVDSSQSDIIASNVMGATGLTKTGDGALELDAAPVISNNAVVEVAAGQLDVNVTSGTPVIGNNDTAQVDSGATLELGGSVSALGSASGNRFDITNNSTVIGGGLVVSGTNQQIGAVNGSGDVVVNAGSDLTADYLRQRTLTIHGTAVSGGLVRIRGSIAPTPHDTAHASVFQSIAIDNDGAPLGARTYYGTLDLMNNDLIVLPSNQDEADALAAYDAVNDMVRAGADWGGWDMAGIQSSTAANDANNLLGLTGIAVMLNDDGSGTPIWGPATSDMSESFDGFSNLTRFDTLVKYTFIGDSFLEGAVSQGDYEYVWSNLGSSPSLNTWTAGDFYYQGMVTSNDALQTFHELSLQSTYQQGPSIASVSVVRDPTNPSQVTLTANDVADWGQIQSVSYYRGSPSDGDLLGVVTGGSDGWSLSPVDISGLTGVQTFVAVATDGTNTAWYFVNWNAG